MIKPIDDAVLVEIKKTEEKTSGGIVRPKTLIERDQMEETDGILVAIGDFAFYDLIANGKSYPQIGDRVYFKRHSGILHYDDPNNKVYRIIHDQDIYGTEEERINREVENG
jgi:co-chaperonin GroES (HSP10)